MYQHAAEFFDEHGEHGKADRERELTAAGYPAVSVAGFGQLISDGRRDRIIMRGKTKTEVKDKLRTKHLELAAGVRAPPGTPSSSA